MLFISVVRTVFAMAEKINNVQRQDAGAASTRPTATQSSAGEHVINSASCTRDYESEYTRVNNQLEKVDLGQNKKMSKFDLEGNTVNDSGYGNDSVNTIDSSLISTEIEDKDERRLHDEQPSEQVPNKSLRIDEMFQLLIDKMENLRGDMGVQNKQLREDMGVQTKQLNVLSSQMKAQGEKLEAKIDTVDKKVGVLKNTIAEMKQEINWVNKKVDSVQTQVNDINERFGSEIINIQNKIEPIVETKVDEKVFGLKTDIIGQCQSQISQVKASVRVCEQKCEHNTSQVQVKITDLEKKIQTQPACVVDRLSTSKLLEGEEKFDPSRKHNGWHPLDFIKNCERVFPENFTDLEKINVVIGALAGDAKRWGLNLDLTNLSFSEFKSKFTEEYWSEQKQDSLWRDFVMARLHENKSHNSLKEFCENWYRKLTHLRNRRSESEIIWELWKKLPEDSKRYVGSSHRSFAVFLEKVQDEDHWRSGRDYRQHNAGNRNNNTNQEHDNNNDQYRVNVVQRGRGRGRGRFISNGRGRGFTPRNVSNDESEEN